MSAIDPTATLGALVAERPARAPLFERLRLDYCCGGSQTLAEACRRRGLDSDTVRTVLAALDDEANERQGFEDVDWRGASVEELCGHIVAVHHDGLRDTMPQIERLLSTVVRVHSRDHPQLGGLQQAFLGIRAQLEPHLESEEDALFPACLALEQQLVPIDAALLDRHEQEHQQVGDALAALRELSGDYDSEHALCGTHRALLEALAAFELDLHQHIHEENNVLLPRVRELAADARPIHHATGDPDDRT
jgi:regulator of cell morphogenesis and NO signaling